MNIIKKTLTVFITAVIVVQLSPAEARDRNDDYFWKWDNWEPSSEVSYSTQEDCCDTTCKKNIEVPCNFAYSPIRLFPSHTEGKWMDNEDGYTSVDFFYAEPLGCNSKVFPVIDLRGHVFNEGRYAANLGGGLRYLTESNLVLGINGFYDYRKGHWDHQFHQAGAGLELLGECIDFRVNGYLPIGKVRASSRPTIYTFDQYVAICKRDRWARAGGDAEIGAWITRNNCYCIDLYGAIGSYYYAQNDCNSHALGAQARLRTHLWDYVTVEVRGGYDQIYKGSCQVTVDIQNVFGLFKSCCTDLCVGDLPYQPIQRQEIIIQSPSRCCWEWNWDSPSTKCGSSGDDD